MSAVPLMQARVALDDFDGDGRTDLVRIVRHTSAMTQRFRHAGRVIGIAPDGTSIPRDAWPEYVAAAGDFDRDNRGDYIRGEGRTARIELADGTSLSLVARGTSRPLEDGVLVVGVGDLNGDDQDDLLSVEPTGFGVYLGPRTVPMPDSLVPADETRTLPAAGVVRAIVSGY